MGYSVVKGKCEVIFKREILMATVLTPSRYGDPLPKVIFWILFKTFDNKTLKFKLFCLFNLIYFLVYFK